MYATSPINVLPTGNLESLLKYILSNPIAPYQLALYNNQIFVSYRVCISDVFSGSALTVQQNLSKLIIKADEMDDYFVQTFGCEKSNYARKIH